MPLTTDFNVSPYFDDYDPANNYYRILFRPAVAVQARELTQSQSILQAQIERFGNHIFKDGSVVEGCNPTTVPNLPFVRVSDTFTANANAFVTDITSEYLLVGGTSNVRAVSIISKAGALLNYPDTNRFYLKYLTTGANSQTTFANGEVISIYSANQNKLSTTLNANNLVNTINVISTNATVNAIGAGYGFRVEDGIVYQKGFFQTVDDQYTIVKDYDQNVASYVVGFETVETIITENEDANLTDNALGYSNENAPGAHRLKLTPTIVAKNRTSIANNDTFFTLFEFSNISNELVVNRQKTPYEVIGDVMNQRTYDESGDYVTKPFQVETIVGANTSSFAYQVSSGKGYVHGGQVEYLSSRKIDTDKAITTLEAPEQIITANYGNYLYLKETAGVVNFSGFVEVDIYDTVQQAITNKTLATGTVTGSKIGTAKVKAYVHGEGDPGLPDTTYRIYLTDIVMISGKSFVTDAKAIYKSDATYGKFFGDIVLTSSKALLQESGKTTLIFPFGKKAVKTLRSDAGATNRTQFYFRETVQATMQTNGYISVAASPAYAGGFDSIGYSTGVLGDTLEKEFVVSLQSNVSTANITSNTVNITSGCTHIIGTNLNTFFANGEFIKLNETASITNYYRVISANSSKIVMSSAPGYTNAACSFGKHYPAGYYIPLDIEYPGTRQVNILSGSSLEISTGSASAASLLSTANVWVQFRMLRTQAVQAKKDINRDRFVKLYANSAVNNIWNLGLPDVFRIVSVTSNSSSFSNTGTDVTNYFYLDNGQRDEYYDHGKLVLNPKYTGTLANEYLTVKLDHFTSNLNNGVGFFSVDSYPIDDANTANTNAIQTAQIPYYIASNNVFIDLRDSADFRPFKSNTANSSTSLASATLNPATTNNFISYSSTYLCEPDTNFQADIEYYLGRIDLVTMNSTGGLAVIKGTPSETPVRPINDTDTMILCYGFVAPYPSLSVREAEAYNRKDYSVRTQLSTQRGYTMRDIGNIEARINRLEYYTTLNLLEQKANALNTPDSNGLNRFKNGIFADPMNSHALAQPNDIEYRYSIDFDLSYGRSLFDSKNIDLTFDTANSSGVIQTGKIITLPYTHEKYIDQPFATKYRNSTQEIWAWKGGVDLYPGYDMNRDETKMPNIDLSIDLTTPFLEFGNIVSQATGATIFGTRWGDWRSTGSTTTVTNVITTVDNQVRNGTNTFLTSINQKLDLGKYVTDVTIQPYMKSRTVAFIARNLKPNTKIYAYFDDTPVSQYCAPATLNTALGATEKEIFEAASKTTRPDSILVRTLPLGTQLTTDASGHLYGVFVIPEGTFRIGDRQFQLIDADSLITGNDAALTRASAVYTASSISLSTRNATITAVEPVFNQSSLTDKRVVTTVQAIPREDPLAQSFFVEPPQEQSGVFITKVDLFFKGKDPSLGVKLVVVGMNNGVPDATMTYGQSRLASADVNVSDIANTATTFVLEQPAFLAANKEYAFYVEPEGGSPEYKIWMAETGGYDVISGAQVFGNPYTGVAFRSSNARTWTPLPKEDIKFNLYVGNFSVGTGTAVLTNENDEYFKYTGLTFPNANTNLRSLKVGDQVYIINSTSNTAIVNTSISGYLQDYDTTKSILSLDSSTAGFSVGNPIGFFRFNQQSNTSHANSTTLIATATINTISNPILHTIVPRFATMVPMNTTIDLSFKGISNSGILDTNWNTITMDQEREMLDYERIVYSKSNEGITKSLIMKTVMTSYNKYITPVIDLSRRSALVIENLINNDNTNEHTRYGNALTKYINKPVVLADGQDAEDLKVIVGAYRPINTDVEVYIKFLNSDDSANINDKIWTKLENASPSVRSSPINIYDWREYEYNIPTTAPATYAGFRNASNYYILEYTDSTGAIYRSFKTFMIKIVLLSSDRIYVPKINDIRAIALQV